MKNKIIKLLIRHNIINFLGFSVVAILNIALIPIIIKNYGLEGFGLLAIIRYMLPTGILGLFDFGLPEAITRFVAHARGESSESSARSIVTFGLLTMTAIGVVAALVFYLLTKNTALISDHNGYLAELFPFIALTSLIMFSGIGVESVIKGMENFSLIRITEIIRAVTYFSAVIIIAYNEISIIYVIYAMLSTYWLQHLLYFAVFFKSKEYPKPGRGFMSGNKGAYWAYARTVLAGKIISNIMVNLPPFLIAPVDGLKSVGIYEALIRLPKYVKTVLSIINASVMPISARLRGEGDLKSEKALLLNGTELSSFVFLPILVCTIALSDIIINLWLGEDMLPYAVWFGVIFLLPFMTNYLTVGKSMLVVHKNELAKINRIAVLQLVIFSALGLAFIKSIPEASFILGIVVAQMVAMPLQIRVISSFYGITSWLMVKPLVWVIISSVLPVIILILVKDKITGLTELIISGIVYVAIHWGIIFSTYFDKAQREQVFRLIGRKA